jgi:ABC-type uncharacterized transport system substrate-binding protein
MGAAADPLESGLIAGLARPGGNTTGLSLVSAELAVKRLEILKQIMTKAARIAILQQPANPAHSIFIKEVEPIAGVLGLTYRILQVRGLEDFEPSFASMRAWQADAIFVLDDATFIASRAAMAAAATRHRLPLICGAREMAEAGCLFSYSASIKDMWYRSASFVDKILKGAKPADLPVPARVSSTSYGISTGPLCTPGGRCRMRFPGTGTGARRNWRRASPRRRRATRGQPKRTISGGLP